MSEKKISLFVLGSKLQKRSVKLYLLESYYKCEVIAKLKYVVLSLKIIRYFVQFFFKLKKNYFSITTITLMILCPKLILQFVTHFEKLCSRYYLLSVIILLSSMLIIIDNKLTTALCN